MNVNKKNPLYTFFFVDIISDIHKCFDVETDTINIFIKTKDERLCEMNI
jgi:hypothetical protein